MKVIALNRRHGKTTQLVQWVKDGHAIDDYPFWSRVLLVPTSRQEEYVRKTFGLTARQVFWIDDWADGRGADINVEVAIDNADEIIRRSCPATLISVVSLTESRNTVTVEISEKLASALEVIRDQLDGSSPYACVEWAIFEAARHLGWESPDPSDR